MLFRECPGNHQHTPLEGYIPGAGQRSKLAENYPPKLAAKLAEALVTQVNHWDDVNAAEELNEVYNKGDGVGELEGESPPVTVSQPVQRNRELQRQVGNRPLSTCRDCIRTWATSATTPCTACSKRSKLLRMS